VTADWLTGHLHRLGNARIAAHILIGFLGIFILISIMMVLDILLVWIERKVVRASRTASGRTAWDRLA
jgi:NADH:ubiquinone oxidoreductase subunit H